MAGQLSIQLDLVTGGAQWREPVRIDGSDEFIWPLGAVGAIWEGIAQSLACLHLHCRSPHSPASLYSCSYKLMQSILESCNAAKQCAINTTRHRELVSRGGRGSHQGAYHSAQLLQLDANRSLRWQGQFVTFDQSVTAQIASAPHSLCPS